MKLIVQKLDSEPIISLDYLLNHYLFRDINDSYEYLLSLLTKAVDIIEDRSGIFLRNRTLKLIHNNCLINLIGPVNEILSMMDGEKNIIKPLEIIRSNDNVFLRFDESIKKFNIIYNTGYTKQNLPKCLQDSILAELFKLYEQDRIESKSDEFKDFSNCYLKVPGVYKYV